MCSAPTHPVKLHQKISQVTGTKFMKFLKDAEGSSGMKVSHPFCDLPQLCGMSAHKMKTVMSVFADSRHKSVTTATSLKRAVSSQFKYTIIKPTNRCIFAECLVYRVDFGGNNKNVQPLQIDHISRIYCIKVYYIFIRYTWFIGGLRMGIGFAIFPTVVECQRTKRRRGVSIFADMHHRSVTTATSL